MSNYIATTALEFSITPEGSAGTVTVNSTPSTKVKCDNKFIYTSPLSITVAGYIDSTGNVFAQTTAATASIQSSAQKSTSGSAVMLEGDSVTVTLTGTNPTSGATGITLPVVVKIKSAGQKKVKSA